MKRSGFLGPFFVVTLVAATLLQSPASAAKRHKKVRKRTPTPVANFDTKLPVLGTHLLDFPPGPVRPIVENACLGCHSGDILWQQRLTDQQWTTEVNKMVGWGSPLPENQREALIAYLTANFGPDNGKFQPVATRPVGK